MPRKPRFNHPVRQVRTCLGHSQPAFAKLIGCSPRAVERIENGTLQLSPKLANSILEATGADPFSLLAGRDATALDMMGREYDKESYGFYKGALPCDEKEMKFLLLKIFQQLQLLFAASRRGGKFRTYAVNMALQRALMNIADHFALTESIQKFLIDQGQVKKRTYRVSDLRKFAAYAHILQFKDNKRFKPSKLISFTLPCGWITHFYLVEKPVLPHGADMKLRDAHYIVDDEHPIPETIKEAVAQADYWEIVEFRADLSQKPVR